MVDPDDFIVEEQFDLDLDRDDDPFSGNICLKEGGDLQLHFEEGEVTPQQPIEPDSLESWSTISGRGSNDRKIHIERAFVSEISNFSLSEVDITSATIEKNEEKNCPESGEIAIDFDITCFKTSFPPRDQSSSVRSSTNDCHDLSGEFEMEYFEEGQQSFSGVSLSDTRDRVNFVKANGAPIRTGKIRVRQDVSGDIAHQASLAKSEVQKLLEVSELVQETSPQIIRGKVIAIEGSPPAEKDVYYEELYTGSTGSVGGQFAEFPSRNLWGDFPEYLEEAYEGYTDEVREDFHLQRVLSYYIDARISGRVGEGSLLSTCSAIELLSLWHARKDEVSETTGEKIEHTINKLGVEVDDLISASETDRNDIDREEYFWKKSRNHVTHGDPNRTTDQLHDDQQRALVVLKRLIRNQLLGEENEKLDHLYDMSPPELVIFDN